MFHNLLTTYIQGSFPLIMINTSEVDRAVAIVSETVSDFNKDIASLEANDVYLKTHGLSLVTWDGYSGLVKNNEVIEGTKSQDDAFRNILSSNNVPSVFIFKYPNLIWHDSFEAVLLSWNVLEFVRRARVTANYQYLILIGDTLTAPKEIQKEAVVIDLELPNRLIIKDYIVNLVTEFGFKFKKENIDKAAEAAMGMTLREVDNSIRASIVKSNGKHLEIDTIYAEKKHSVKRSGLLELVETNENSDTLGDWGDFKEWLYQTSVIFQNSDKAKEFGLPPPKGALLFGISGCGKTLAAKVAANILNVPLYRCDIGRLYDSLVGSTERNTRALFSLIDAIAPCVVLFDEIEKMFSGLGSSDMSDAGITSKLVSSMLYYMEERNTPAFFVGTANNVTSLKPELLRKGRWDELWFVDLPNSNGRKEILDIWLKKSGRSLSDIVKNPNNVVNKLKNFTGVEIKTVVHDAIKQAFISEREVTETDLIKAIEKIVPMAATKKEEISALRAWAATRARLANTKEEEFWASEASTPKVITKKK